MLQGNHDRVVECRAAFRGSAPQSGAQDLRSPVKEVRREDRSRAAPKYTMKISSLRLLALIIAMAEVTTSGYLGRMLPLVSMTSPR